MVAPDAKKQAESPSATILHPLLFTGTCLKSGREVEATKGEDMALF